MEDALSVQPNLAGVIKPDFTGYHHRGAYANAYTPQALHLSAVVCYLLRGTQFALPRQAAQNLKSALCTLDILSNHYDVPTALCGRFPDKSSILHEILPAFAYLSLAADPVDLEMAGIFMRLWDADSDYLKNGLFPRCGADIVYYDTLGDLELLLDFAARGYEKAAPPQGNWVLPYAATAVHRRGGWMAVAKGWSQYVWDYEAGRRRENLLGRYCSYGSLQLLASGEPVSARASGYHPARGWDWNRWPGTTAIRLPLEELNYLQNGAVHRIFTDETFVGGVSDGENGVFAVKLHDPHYSPAFRANKTMFFLGGAIVCLGSDITSDDTAHPVQTTLFQCFLDDEHAPMHLNSADPLTDFPLAYQGKTGETVWLRDPCGNGYIVPHAQGLHLARAAQQSMDHAACEQTQGPYATAWLDHSAAPAGAAYRYTVLVQASPEEIDRYARSPEHRVVQCDARAHIVAHEATGSLAYALFDPDYSPSEGPLTCSDTPILALAVGAGDTLRLHIADPDLRLPRLKNMESLSQDVVLSPSRPRIVRLKLRGTWELCEGSAGAAAACRDDETLLELQCRDGAAQSLILRRR